MQTELCVSNCLGCSFCKIMDDPDPDDLHENYKRIYCRKANMEVATSVEPKDLESEADIPAWCPLNK